MSKNISIGLFTLDSSILSVGKMLESSVKQELKTSTVSGDCTKEFIAYKHTYIGVQ